MGKDYKQKALAKFKQGLVDWEDVPEGLKKQADRYNFDGGEYRAKKLRKVDKASKKDMKRQLSDIEKGKEEDN